MSLKLWLFQVNLITLGKDKLWVFHIENAKITWSETEVI